MLNLKETAEKFGVSSPAFLKYINNHLDEVNVDGEHAKQNSNGKWEFDEVAIKRLTEMRKEITTSPLVRSPEKIDRKYKLEEIFSEIHKLNNNFSGLAETQQEIFTEVVEVKKEISEVEQKQKKFFAEVQNLQTELNESLAEVKNILKKQSNEVGVKKLGESKAEESSFLSNLFWFSVTVVVLGAIGFIIWVKFFS